MAERQQQLSTGRWVEKIRGKITLRAALGQFNASVGDIAGNLKTMRRFYDEASEFEVDVLAFPEVCVCGTGKRPNKEDLSQRSFTKLWRI